MISLKGESLSLSPRNNVVTLKQTNKKPECSCCCCSSLASRVHRSCSLSADCVIQQTRRRHCLLLFELPEIDASESRGKQEGEEEESCLGSGDGSWDPLRLRSHLQSMGLLNVFFCKLSLCSSRTTNDARLWQQAGVLLRSYRNCTHTTCIRVLPRTCNKFLVLPVPVGRLFEMNRR